MVSTSIKNEERLTAAQLLHDLLHLAALEVVSVGLRGCGTRRGDHQLHMQTLGIRGIAIALIGIRHNIEAGISLLHAALQGVHIRMQRFVIAATR